MQPLEISHPHRILTLACTVLATLAGFLSLVTAASSAEPAQCAAGGGGFLKAKIAGAIDAEIDWPNKGTVCTGEARPSGGVRLSFKNRVVEGSTLLIVFGIPDLAEGQSAQALPANITVVREGTGQFYGTQGLDKCTIDSVRQEAVKGAPHRNRIYRVIARGFCTEPARALQGEGSILISRFDFAGLLNFEDDAAADAAPADQKAISP